MKLYISHASNFVELLIMLTLRVKIVGCRLNIEHTPVFMQAA
jgi:hypothetical protein